MLFVVVLVVVLVVGVDDLVVVEGIIPFRDRTEDNKMRSFQ